MLRLFMIILPIVATALAGSAVIAALSAGFDDLKGILIAAAIGAVISLPASWLIAKKIAA